MKLIDILVRELPERGGWPETASTATQDSDGEICFSSGGKHEYYITSWKGGKWTGDGFMAEHAIDYEISIISREQYESALAASKEMTINKPDSDGWISWCGGECPVDGDMMVDVRFRAQGQADLDGDVADNFRWEHFSNAADIVAYRLHKPEHQKPEWDGEGLPPVGCECEYETKFDGWQPVRIELIKSEGIAFTWLANSQAYNGLDCVGVQKSGSFRPIRSEADKKRAEGVIALSRVDPQAMPFEYGDKHSDGSLIGPFWYELYDAIVEGKIPHIRID